MPFFIHLLCLAISSHQTTIPLKLAAIDIGSNAIRMQVSKVLDVEQYHSKKIEYIRFPLRLGQDVFSYGEITPKTEEKFVKLMLAFKQFLELYEVDDYMVCATSAMREAHNGLSIAKRVYYNVGLKVNIIDGEEEGNIINIKHVHFNPILPAEAVAAVDLGPAGDTGPDFMAPALEISIFW